jgi:hypothetical protein
MSTKLSRQVKHWLARRMAVMPAGDPDAAEFTAWFHERYQPIAGGWQY